MSLSEKILNDMKRAQKAGEAMRLETLRFVAAQIHNAEIEKRGGGNTGSLSDDETVAVLQRELKKRKEAIELFVKGNRADLAKKEEASLSVIREYVPRELTEEEVRALVDEVVEGGIHDFAAAMKEVMRRAGGRASGKAVSEIIRAKLQ